MNNTVFEALQQYLLDMRLIDPLAKRQAALICRPLRDEALKLQAGCITLLLLAALRRGVPRADRQNLLHPLSPEMLTFAAETYRGTGGGEAPWALVLTDASAAVAAAVTALFKNPAMYTPLCGEEPAMVEGVWPLMVCNGECIGFSRYWASVRKLEKVYLPGRCTAAADSVTAVAVKDALQSVFVENTILTGEKQFHYRQVAAAALACRTRFLTVSGGPGTGKTSVVLQILRTLVRVFPHLKSDRIVLCAPTGRAKARLGESIDAGLALLKAHNDNRTGHLGPDATLFALQRKTIHRLLGQRPDGKYRYCRENPLPFQVVVVDEASMVDLTLFSALMEACSSDCRLLLIGDMHQLPSVEAGAVLGDLTESFSEHATFASLSHGMVTWIQSVTGEIPAKGSEHLNSLIFQTEKETLPALSLVDKVIILTHSYRSSTEILELADVVNRGDAATTAQILLLKGSDATVSLNSSGGLGPVNQWILHQLQQKPLIEAYKTVDDTSELISQSAMFIKALKTILHSSAILTLAHEGPRGRRAVNALAAKLLREKLDYPSGDRFFHGLPIILGSNHHDLNLYNGDIGMVVQSRTEGVRACFLQGEHCFMVALDRLINPEPAFALTVHKAQGSEFESVLLVLPEGVSPLLNRQILYTGITRAKKRVQLLGSIDLLKKAVTTKELRSGGIVIA